MPNRVFQPKLTGFPENVPTFENFIDGENALLIALLRQWLQSPSSWVFFLYGESGSGTSHLLKACALPYVDVVENPSLNHLPTDEMLALDHFQFLNEEGQQVFFDAFNQKEQFFLVAGNQPPIYLNLRDDVKNRLGTGLIYRLKSLAEAQKKQALLAWAKQEGVHLPDSALHYLLTHAPRDMKSLQNLLKKSDDYCLMHKRALTVPVIKYILENCDEFGAF